MRILLNPEPDWIKSGQSSTIGDDRRMKSGARAMRAGAARISTRVGSVENAIGGALRLRCGLNQKLAIIAKLL